MIPGFFAAGSARGGGVGSGDPYWTNVVSLLQFQGPEGSTDIFDEKGVGWVLRGSPRLSTDNPLFGISSLFLDGASSIAASSPGFAFGTDPYTVELWWLFNAVPLINGNLAYWGASGPDGNPVGGLFELASGNGLVFWRGGNRVSGTSIVGAGYRHVALARGASGHSRLFIDGVLQGSFLDATNYTSTWVKLGRFASGNDVPSSRCAALRITAGVARYTSNFTPPTAPFPNGP